MSQLDGKEETFVTIELHHLNDPERFIISRLLDPHCLEYAWPFGGLYFTFTVVGEGVAEEEKKNDQIFVENASLHGASWNVQNECLCMDLPNKYLGTIRGVPTDSRNIVESEDLFDVPVYSAHHSRELFKVPLKVGRKSKDFWGRKNVFITLG